MNLRTLLVFFAVLSCQHQNKTAKYLPESVQLTNQPKNLEDTMHTFNINKYNSWTVDTRYLPGDEDKFFIKDELAVKILQFKHTIQVEEGKIYSPYLHTKVYDLQTKKLISDFYQFYNIPVFTGKNYDANGSVIEEINYDHRCGFTLPQLVDKIKKEYNVDLEDRRQNGSVELYEDTEAGSFYRIRLSKEEMKIFYILVDCETGKTLFTMNSYWRGGIDPVQKYIDSLKK